jgi:glycosyltransferase involved in cell wall biosynthesis
VRADPRLRVLIAGGVFRLSAEERSRRQPAPEMLLADGLRARGVHVRTSRLEDWRQVVLARDYDVVHVHHLSKAALAAALSPADRPFVFTEHASGRAATPTHRAAQRLVMARTSTVVCLSEAEAVAKRNAYRLPTSRVEVIPNGASFAPTDCRLRSIGAEEPVVLLFVGQLRPVKQVHRAVRALAELPRRCILRLVYHNDEGLEDLRVQARALGVADRITFVGQLASEKLIEQYQQAHLLLLPSASEALPSVVSEALLTGLPVVASAVGGIPGQVGDAGELVTPSIEDSIAPAIAAVIADYTAYAARAVARCEAVAAEYSVDRMISRHLALYRRLQERLQ